jgi:hypothetical protein
LRGVVLASDHGPVVYLTLTLRLSEEATDTPVIEVIRAVRSAAVSLAAARGDDPDPAEVMAQARRRLGLAG